MSDSPVLGSLLGVAVGDALGLPYEGISPRRAERLLGPADRYRFCFGRGMVSDDTEHTCIVAQALVASGAEPEKFERELASRMRIWLLGLPAGIGWATLRAGLRLWLGFGPRRSGVWSAGNGPAMRVAILGAAVDDAELTRRLVQVTTRITHTDPRAEHAALAVALAARMARQGAHVDGNAYLDEARVWLGAEAGDMLSAIENAARSVANGQSTRAFAAELEMAGGVSGFVMHCTPVVVHAWLSHPRDFQAAVTSVIECGGDTDTTAAMVGGIVGAGVGKEGIPQTWRKGLCEWPRTLAWMEKLARQVEQVAESRVAANPVRLSAPGLLLRNLFFLAVVLVHVGRRLLPPY